MLFSNLDIFIVAFYCVGIIFLAQYVSRSQQGVEKTAEDYFLAGRSLPWWAIGASLIEIFLLNKLSACQGKDLLWVWR